MRRCLCFLTLVFAAAASFGGDCTVSKPFEVRQQQRLSSVLEDHTGAAITGAKLQLLSGEKLVRELHAQNAGAYDFGEVAPGTYRIRLVFGGNDFCAPTVKCRGLSCNIGRRVKLNPKIKTVTVD